MGENGYQSFIDSKAQLGSSHGFDPIWLHDKLFDFQKHLVEWSLRKGRGGVFADCGLGKTLIQLVWAENIVKKTNKPVLILTPLAVGPQTKREGEIFHIGCDVSRDGRIPRLAKIVVTNYQRLHHFDPADFVGVVADESSILKNFDGKTKAAVTEFMRRLPYRLLCTATAAPNDYIELGTSSEALGELGYMDMLSKFFKNDQNSNHPNRQWSDGKWRFRGHAEQDFWRWVCSWARAVRKPSDLGYDDGRFVLPELKTVQHMVEAKTLRPGFMFETAAITLLEQRQERRRTISERCQRAADLINTSKANAVAWCHLNDEGDMLEKMIPGSVQVSGKDDDDSKEEKLVAFQNGGFRVLVTKPTIAGFGLNWQHCAHQTFFPSHSFEQWYQAIRRSWRFGQTRPVTIDVVTSEGEAAVLGNLQRKADAADDMFTRLVASMNNEMKITRENPFKTTEEVPAWL